MNGRPRKIWLIELGYFSNTRYMEKVTEKKEQHAELCEVLAAEGYHVRLLPVVLGSAGTLCKCLDRATKEMDILYTTLEKRNYTASFTYTVYTVRSLCPNGNTWKDKSHLQK
jgi:hypothetical protein